MRVFQRGGTKGIFQLRFPRNIFLIHRTKARIIPKTTKNTAIPSNAIKLSSIFDDSKSTPNKLTISTPIPKESEANTISPNTSNSVHPIFFLSFNALLLYFVDMFTDCELDICSRCEQSIYAHFVRIRYVAYSNESRLRLFLHAPQGISSALALYRTRSVYRATHQRRISTRPIGRMITGHKSYKCHPHPLQLRDLPLLHRASALWLRSQSFRNTRKFYRCSLQDF